MHHLRYFITNRMSNHMESKNRKDAPKLASNFATWLEKIRKRRTITLTLTKNRIASVNRHSLFNDDLTDWIFFRMINFQKLFDKSGPTQGRI